MHFDFGARPPSSSSWSWDGWGCSLAWFADVIGARPDVTAEISRLLFRDLGLDHVRYNIGASSPDVSSAFRPGGAVPCVKPRPDAPVDLDLDRRQLDVLRCALRDRPDIGVHVFCNSPPHYMTRSGSSKGARDRWSNNLRDECIPGFVAFVEEVVEALEADLGVVVRTVELFNEPYSFVWVDPASRQEGCRVGSRQSSAVLSTALASSGIGGRQCAFDENSVLDALVRMVRVPASLWSRARVVGVHTYALTEFSDGWWAKVASAFQDNALLRRFLASWTRRRGVPLCVTEYGTGKSAAHLVRHVLRDLRTLKPTAWCYWQPVEDASSSWGLVALDFDAVGRGDTDVAVTCTPKFRAMRLLTTHLPAGCRMWVDRPTQAIVTDRPSFVYVTTASSTVLRVSLPRFGRVRDVIVDAFDATSETLWRPSYCMADDDGLLIIDVGKPDVLVGCTVTTHIL